MGLLLLLGTREKVATGSHNMPGACVVGRARKKKFFSFSFFFAIYMWGRREGGESQNVFFLIYA